MWFYIIIGIFFIIIGAAIHLLKWHFLISGYNTMSKEKKANVDAEGLARLMGIYSYLNGGILLTVGVLHGFNIKIGATLVFAFIIFSTIYLLIKAQKYDGNIYDKERKIRKGAGKKLVLPIVIAIISLVFTALVMIISSQPTRVTLSQGEIGTHGSALGSNMRGYFRTKELDKVKLFVNSQNPPFIFLKTDKGITIFNLDNAEETRKVFEEIIIEEKQIP